MAEPTGSTRRAKRFLSAEQKYEIWLKVLSHLSETPVAHRHRAPLDPVRLTERSCASCPGR